MLKPLFFLILILSVASLTWAQDSTHQEKKGVISTIREKVNAGVNDKNLSTDSIKNKLAVDSTKKSLDSLQRSKWNAKDANQKYDSIQQLFEKQNKITSITATVTKLVNKPIDKVESVADTRQQKVETFVQGQVDSLKQRLEDSVNKINSKVENVTKPVEDKAVAINEKIETKTEKIQSGIQNGFDKATEGNVKAPVDGLDAPGIKLPGAQAGVEGIGDVKTAVPGLSTDVPGVDIPKESLKIPDANLNVDQLKQKTNLDISEVDNVKDIKGEMGGVDSKLAEAEKYQKELQGLKKMDSASVQDVGKRIEDKAGNIQEVQKLEEQKQLITKQQLEYKKMMDRYQDKKLMKAEIERKSRNVVNGKIDKLTPAFKEAQEKIAEAKKLNSNVDKYKEGKIKRENTMESIPRRERFVPGITLQVYNKDVFTIDWGLQLGYKLSKRVLAGAGGVYRMNVSEKYHSWIKSPGVCGYRSYVNFNLIKGFYAHGEFEGLRLRSFVDPQTQIEVGAQQVYSGYFGLGKRYDISKKIRGSAIVLYRAEFEGDLPSMSKINLRIGFDYSMKKRTKVKPTLSSSK